MTGWRSRCSMLALQYSLGIVVLIQALIFALAPGAGRAFHKTGMPDIVRLGIAWGEVAGAVLLLVPWTAVIGGRILMAICLAAIAIHLLHGMRDVGYLVIYASAAWAVVESK
jgi:hypothetical protein